MSLSPELARLPRVANSFRKAGLLGELVWGMISRENSRDLISDARRLLNELEKKTPVDMTGEENWGRLNGGVVVFNHPNIEVLLPAMLKIFVAAHDHGGQQIRLVMASEIPLTTKNFNEKTSVPGSIELMSRFHNLYSRNIVPVPTAEDRSDYMTGRTVAVRKVMRAITTGDLVFISPEGHVEKHNQVSPVDSYHKGAGKLMIMAARLGKPTVPVGIWQTDEKVRVAMGQPFTVETEDPELAAVEAMFQIAQNLPTELRGPFED